MLKIGEISSTGMKMTNIWVTLVFIWNLVCWTYIVNKCKIATYPTKVIIGINWKSAVEYRRFTNDTKWHYSSNFLALPFYCIITMRNTKKNAWDKMVAFLDICWIRNKMVGQMHQCKKFDSACMTAMYLAMFGTPYIIQFINYCKLIWSNYACLLSTIIFIYSLYI